jgi:hypothetical protein
VAGPNPWNADTLEWDVASPPPAYGVLSIPTVASRHPLWDAHEESADPNGERRFDHSRLTLSTSWLAAQPKALSQMPEDTTLPWWLSMIMTAWFAAVLVPAPWTVAALTGPALAVAAWWLWPKPEKVMD